MSKFRDGAKPVEKPEQQVRESRDRAAYCSTEKEILYVDMDGVIADFKSAVYNGCGLDTEDFKSNYETVKRYCILNPRIFLTLPVIPGAIEGVNFLREFYDIYFASTPMSYVKESYSDKASWLQKYFGDWAVINLKLTHHKHLLHGDYIIDDTTRNGVDKFKGRHIHFGTEKFPNWPAVVSYLSTNKHHKVI